MKRGYYWLLLLFPLLSASFSGKAQVNADFSINYQFPNCSPTVVTFVNTSSGGTTPYTYQWNFGKNAGINSTQSNPSSTYDICGTYNVSLTVIDAAGKKSTKIKPVKTNCEPEANFIVSGGQSCIPSVANFTSTSLSGSGSLVDYVWDFGDGYKGTGPNPSHTYTTSGCKTVTLIISNSNGCIDDTTFNNVVCPAASPIAGFTSTQSEACYAPLKIDYTPTVTGNNPPFTYKWDFQGGAPATSMATNPSINYNSPGFYSTQLIVVDNKGCTDTLKRNNYVLIGNNIADFDILSTKGCAPFYAYCNFPSNQASRVDWTAPGSAYPTWFGTDFITIYNSPGTYQICMSVTYPGNCVIQTCKTITVGGKPKADFSVTGNNTVCVPPINNVQFTNKSTGTGTLFYSWDFPGGTPSSSSSANPPPITYKTCGNFGVTLIVTNAEGCTDTLRRDSLININCPVANVNVSATKGCIPYDVSFNSTGSTGNPVKWWWNFGDAANSSIVQSTQQNPSHTYTTTGCFNVRLIIENGLGCRDTVVLNNYICTGTKPTVDFSVSPTIVCAGMPVTFSNLSTGITLLSKFFWDFKGGPPYTTMSTAKNPIYTYSDTGTFDVSLIVNNNGCADTLNKIKQVRVKPPIAVLSVDKNCINKDDVTLHGEASIGADTYLWTIPGGSPATSTSPSFNVHFNSTGNYIANLTVTNNSTGCSNTTKQNIYIRHVKADFSIPITTGCRPFQPCMTNTSIDASSYSWQYTVPPGIIKPLGSTVNPCPVLTVPGKYGIKLTAIDANGCKDTISMYNSITVYGLDVKFTGTGFGCAPLSVTFSDSVTSPTSIPVGWNWDFGDPLSGASNYSTKTNPTHIYKNDGVFNVVLSVTDNKGCVTTVPSTSQAVTVSKPLVKFVASDSSVCLGNSVCFTSQATSAISFFKYSWDFGDNTTPEVVPNPCHTYADTGWYTVKLVATNWIGCKDSVVKKKFIHVISPFANFRADSTATSCPPLQVNFSNLSFGSDTTTKWLWDFGDGSGSTSKNPFHIYTRAGSFTVKLKMTSGNGCSNAITFINYINITGPIANVTITPSAGCNPLHTCFKAQSGNTIFYIWNFGDGSVQQVGKDTICYTYNQKGTYFPQLILNDGLGCVYALPLDSILVADPIANFNITPPSLCGGGQVQFTDSSYSPVQITNWNWDFGDVSSGSNNSSILKNPNHNFNSPGIYPISLSMKDILGCTASTTDTIVVHPFPKADFTSSSSLICPITSVQFTDASVSGDPIATYLWNFNDPTSGVSNTSSLMNPSHLFINPGVYSVKQVINSIYGCSDSITHLITVQNYPTPDAGIDQAICINKSTTISGSGGIIYSWIPSAGLSATNQATVTASPTVSTSYTLTVTDGLGCTASDSVVVKVNDLPTINAGLDKQLCKGLSVSLSVVGGISYSWSPAAGLSNTSISNPNANPGSTTTYTVTGTDGNGCVNTDTLVVNVLSLPVANAGADQSICLAQSAQLTGSGGLTYSWTPAGSLNQSNIFDPVASPTVTTDYILAATDANGCVGNDTINVTVKPLPPANAGTDKDICISFSAQLNATGGISYDWLPASTLDNAAISNPTATPTITTTYTITVTGANGCSSSDAVVVNVHYNPAISAGLDKIICFGTSIPLQGTGGSTYIWSPSTGLNKTSGSAVTASPTITTTYSLKGISNFGCVNYDSIVIKVLPPPPAFAGRDTTICYGEKVLLNASGGASYSWSPSTWLNDSNIQNPEASPLATIRYIVTVEDTNNCNAKDTVQIAVNQLPQINAGPDKELCEGSSTMLNVTGGVSYLWAPSTGLSIPSIANPVADPTITIQYVVTGQDNIGCTNTDTMQLNVIHPFKASVSPDADVCEGNAVLISATGGRTYLWLPKDGLDNQYVSTPFASPTITTNYQVIVTDGMCFADTQYVMVHVHEASRVQASPDVMILAGDKTQLSATGTCISYEWFPPEGLSCADCVNPVATPSATTSYIAVCTNDMGCRAEDTVIITVGCFDEVMYVPNAFTPNGDGQNDKFFVRSNGLRALEFIRIYDRWGELVFESGDQQDGWDGTFRGKTVLSGVYIYYIEATCTNGQRILKQGNITVIR